MENRSHVLGIPFMSVRSFRDNQPAEYRTRATRMESWMASNNVEGCCWTRYLGHANRWLGHTSGDVAYNCRGSRNSVVDGRVRQRRDKGNGRPNWDVIWERDMLPETLGYLTLSIWRINDGSWYRIFRSVRISKKWYERAKAAFSDCALSCCALGTVCQNMDIIGFR